MCLHFLTPYQDKSKLRSSPYVTSYREIAMRYIRGWFVVDMLACIPWDAVYMLISDLQGSGAQIRLLRLMKVCPALRLCLRSSSLSEQGGSTAKAGTHLQAL